MLEIQFLPYVYMVLHKPESVLENEMQKVIRYFLHETSPHPGQKRRLSEEKCAAPENHREKKMKMKRLLTPHKRTKNALEQETNRFNNCNLCARNGPQNLGKGAGKFGNWRNNRDYRNHSILKISRYTDKSPRDLRTRAVSQIMVKDHQLTLAWKTIQIVKKYR